MFVKVFSDFGQNIFRVLSESFRQCCQNYFLRVEKKILRRFFCRKIFVPHFFGHWAKLFPIFGNHFTAWFSKLNRACREEHSEEDQFFFELIGFVKSFSNIEFWEKRLGNVAKKTRQVCPSSLLQTRQKHFDQKTFCEKNI